MDRAQRNPSWRGFRLRWVSLSLYPSYASFSSQATLANGIALHGAAGTGPGTVNVTGAGASLYFNGTQTLDNASGSDVHANPGTTLTLGPDLNTQTTGYAQLYGDTLVNQGTLTVQDGTAYITTPATFDNQGTLTVMAGAALHTSGFVNSGTIAGSGDIHGSIINDGIFAPGTAGSVGQRTLYGDFSQTADGWLEFEVASAASHDVFSIIGDTSLGGTLKLENLGGYAPQVGDILTLALFGGSYGGTFNVDTSAFAGVNFSALYGDQEFALRVDGISAVPIPAAVWLFGSALAGLAVVGRRATPA